MKRIMAFVLSLMMAITCIPCNAAWADEGDTIIVTFDANGGRGGFSGKMDGIDVIKGQAFDDHYMTEFFETMNEKFYNIYGTDKALQTGHNNYGATIDFKNLDSNEKLQTLIGTGFSVTCQTCIGFVCFKFVDGEDYEYKLTHVDGLEWGDTCQGENDRSIVVEVGIKGCNNGNDLIKRIMDNSIAINEQLVKLTDGEINIVNLSQYGLDSDMISTDAISDPYQDITSTDGKIYRFTSGWCFDKQSSQLVKDIERHLLLFGAEYNDSDKTYGSKFYLLDPRAKKDSPSGYSKEDGAIFITAVKEGIYYKALLEPIRVLKTFSDDNFPTNPFLSPDGSKVFVGWTTVKDDKTTLITKEKITKQDDIIVYALWEDLSVIEQPSSQNNYKYKTNINEKWEHKNKLSETLLKSDEAEVDPLFSPVDGFEGRGIYKYRLTYGTKTVETESFEYVPKSSKKYKATDNKDTTEKITGTGKKGATRTIVPEEGRKVTDVIVKDKDGNEVEVTMNEDGTYSFIQPASNVTVEVLYEALTPEEEMQAKLMKDDVKRANSNEGSKINPNAKFVKGYDDGTVKPNKEVSNLELMCMVTQLFEDTAQLNSKEEINLNQGDNEWAGNVAALANGLGLIPGNKNDKNYDLNADVTRGDLAVVIYNLIKDYTPCDKLVDSDNCKDAVGKDYEEAVAKLVSLGILKGYDDGLFHGDNTLTRAEAVVVINRALISLGFEIKIDSLKVSFPDLTQSHWAYDEIMFAANK